MFGLWNPHQASPSPTARPSVRLRVSGSITLQNKYGDYPPGSGGTVYGVYKSPGYAITLNDTVELTNDGGVGVNGFVDPHALLPADVQIKTQPATADAGGKAWATLPAMRDNSVYAGYRLPDFLIDKDKRAPLPPPDPQPLDFFLWGIVYMWVNTNLASPFNCWLEYKAADNKTWVPYTYHAGIENTGLTGLSKQPGFYEVYMGPQYTTDRTGTVTANPPNPLGIDPAPDTKNNPGYYTKYLWGNTDPRTLRFNYTTQESPSSSPDNLKYLYTSIWSPLTESANAPGTSPPLPAVGRFGFQNIPTLFDPTAKFKSWAGSGLARNNNTLDYPPNASSPGAYFDADGIRRVADSGLFTDPPATANNWAGDPYALADPEAKYPAMQHRVSDRPIILHRPFTSVAELVLLQGSVCG